VAVYNGGGWDITLKVLDPIYPSGFGGDVEALSKQVRGVGFRVSGQGLRVQGLGPSPSRFVAATGCDASSTELLSKPA